MNPIVRHFLPSVVRGVYRTDNELSSITDAEKYARFIRAKLQFLPPGIRSGFQKHFTFDIDLQRAQSAMNLAQDCYESGAPSGQRAKTFFEQHLYFGNALKGNDQVQGADNYLEVQFVKRVLAPLLTSEGMGRVKPQHPVGKYFLDFALIGDSKIAIEVDGFGKFKERSDLDNFIARQNFITGQGWRVIRFTYAQIMSNPSVALKWLHTLLKSDAQTLRFLANQQPQAVLMWEQDVGERSLQAIDLVNDFFRIQDHFVDTVLVPNGSSAPYRIGDNFKLGLPFVALAISALYQFLKAVQAVVDVDFELPDVEVSGAPTAALWKPELHALVKINPMVGNGAIEWCAETVQFPAASLPTPPCAAGPIQFRTGLTIDDMQEKLQYFCSSVFGYSQSKNFQDKVLQRVFNGEHVLGISATGSGKSFCFWLPALLRPGLSLIICPLRSLMRDQHQNLRQYGIASAEFINVDVKEADRIRIMAEARLGAIRLLYVSPERLRIKKFLIELAELQQSVPIHFLAVDEAHCISEWGHDFRPAYLKLPFLLEKLTKENPGLQLVALTATAGEQVERDMLGILKLKGGEGGQVIRDPGADRERFSYQIVSVQKGQEKKQKYEKILKEYLPTALKQRSLRRLLALNNQRGEKAVGLVFCIYADPHGKHGIFDGIAHYVFETMAVVEPASRFQDGRRNGRLHRDDAYSTGKVRGYASKVPTLCPNCKSYQYISRAHNDAEDDPEIPDDIGGQEIFAAPNNTAGRKICLNCGAEFDGITAHKPSEWPKVIMANQVDFKEGKYDILVATKGFGMGIDKSSVRFVIHTALSSGIESWYQEIGRAGRDNERAHIVLLVDPPNEACREDLKGKFPKKPLCNNYNTCPLGHDGLCDYGKQHMFIRKSYPGVESDAVSALRVLDQLITSRLAGIDETVELNASNDYLSQTEISIYRLTLLGLVGDYSVTYAPHPKFHVEFKLLQSPDILIDFAEIQQTMQTQLSDYLKYFSNRSDRSIGHELVLRIEEYQPLSNFPAKTARFQNFVQYQELFVLVYQHLLLQLDQNYRDVVTMRYDMLWNLQTIVQSKKCRRSSILPYFGETQEEEYRCGCCDNCSPSLNFLEVRNSPKLDPNNAEKERELEELFRNDFFDYARLIYLREHFVDYPTAKYRQARVVLEHSPNNLSALFFAREFSPSDEYAANDRRLLGTANRHPLALQQLRELYKTSKSPCADLLLTLNDAGSSCDTPDGWCFLMDEAGKPEHSTNFQVVWTRECLDFMLWVERDLAESTHSLKGKARQLKECLNA